MPRTKSMIPVVSSDESVQPRGRGPREGVALCLSGGGYRAMLFHAGALWALNHHGRLATLDLISSVSGGSITAAWLGLRWKNLDFDDTSTAKNFEDEVVRPLRRLAAKTVDRQAVLEGLVSAEGRGQPLVDAYRERLFGTATLQDLPERPEIVINATNVQSGALFRFSKRFLWDYRVGRVSRPATSIAEAAGASSAFPPLLSPVTLTLSHGSFDENTGKDLQRPPFTRRVVLTDGGVYDNLGIESGWKRYKTILVSDAGAKLEPEGHPREDLLRHSLRVLGIVDDQVRNLRKRQLIAAYRLGERSGAYWGIRSDLGHFDVHRPLPCPAERTMKLARMATRLEAIGELTQKRLINWGFAVCDAATRRHVDRGLQAPAEFPYPGARV